MWPAFGGTLGSFEVQQNSGGVRDKPVVDFGRLPVAFFGHGHLPGDRLVSGPKAVCFQRLKTCVHSSRNAPSRFQPSPKFVSATVLKWVLLCPERCVFIVHDIRLADFAMRGAPKANKRMRSWLIPSGVPHPSKRGLS
jgi:hypothetical protein